MRHDIRKLAFESNFSTGYDETQSSESSKGWLEEPDTKSSTIPKSCFSNVVASFDTFWKGGDIHWYMVDGDVVEVVDGKSIVRISDGKRVIATPEPPPDDPPLEDETSTQVQPDYAIVDMNACNAVGSSRRR